MYPDNKKKRKSDPVDSSSIEEYYNLLVRYTRLAINIDISHSLNNFLTTLSVRHTLLKNALSSGDEEKISLRMKALNKAIKNLGDFSTTLATSIHIPSKPTKVKVNRVIKDTVETARSMVSMENFEITLSLSEDSDSVIIDVDSLRILLLSFLFLSRRYYSSPDVLLQSQRNRKPDSLTIEAKTKERDPAAMKTNEKKTINNVGKTLGEIPFITLQRILQSSNKNIRLDIPKSKELGFSCTIFIPS